MYAEVLLPLKLRWIPTYITDIPLHRGEAVKVVFSGRKFTGIVWNDNAAPPSGVKRVLKVLGRDEAVPALSGEEMKLWSFVAGYYLCTLGEVFAMALPQMRLKSEQNASARMERLRGRVAEIEKQLTGKHCERVCLRLEEKRAELLSRIAELSPAETVGALPEAEEMSKREAPDGGRPRLLVSSARIPRYVEIIRTHLSEGRQVLLLTPEVAFADRLEKALSDEFGSQLAVVHSGKSPSSRQRAAARLRSGEALAVLGTRSSIFLPFRKLGLVIIDDEQDPFYKQNEPAPRYNGRDCGVYLAGLHCADVVLGSSCPSLESLLNLRNGKYLLSDTDSARAGSGSAENAAGTLVIDVAAERRKNGMKGPISRKLIAACLKASGPVLLIRGWERQDELAECLKANLPGVTVNVCTIAELKRDGSAGAALIAVLQADALLSKDDFRSDERALQLVSLLQELSANVIIQTEVPQRFSCDSRPAAESSGMMPGPDMCDRYQEFQRMQYEESSGMMRRLDALLSERREFGFPPYTRIVDICRYGESEIVRRIFLRRDSRLAARKEGIFDSLPSDCYADVDPQ